MSDTTAAALTISNEAREAARRILDQAAQRLLAERQATSSSVEEVARAA